MPNPAPLPAPPGPMKGRKLGRKAPTDAMRRKALPLRNFINFAARPVPESDDYSAAARNTLRQMMGNDNEGDCAAVAALKRMGVLNAARPGGKEVTASTAEALKLYHQIGGPGDNGLYMPDVYDWWRDKGFVVGGQVHKIDGYAAVDTSDDALFDAAFHWFGGVDIGVALTNTQYMHATDSDVWTLDGSGVVGGHAVPLTARNSNACKLATWGAEPWVERACLRDRAWCDEAYVVISKESVGPAGLDTNNVNWDALSAALAALKAGGTPDVPTDPNPPAPPVPPAPPGPVDPGVIIDWARDVSALGFTLHLNVKLFRANAQNAAAPNWLSAVLLAWDIVSAVRAADWTRAATLAGQLLAMLGEYFGAHSAPKVAAFLDGARRALLPGGAHQSSGGY